MVTSEQGRPAILQCQCCFGDQYCHPYDDHDNHDHLCHPYDDHDDHCHPYDDHDVPP